MVRFCVVMAVLGAALSLSSCDLLTGTHTYRYRVTVDVETPDGLRSGSSVWQVKTHEGNALDRRRITQLKAEAVPVELPGGMLFALMRSQDLDGIMRECAAGVVEDHVGRHPTPGLAMTRDWAENMRRIAEAKPAFDVDPAEYPMLVRFRDRNEPASVERVDSSALSDAFASGTSLKRIRIEVTDDRPVDKILQLLPWLEHHRGALERCRGTPILERPLKCRLTNGDFRRED